MSSVDKAFETQMKNIQVKTGKTMEELAAIVHNSGLSKHSELRAMLQSELGLGYGDATMLVHAVLQTDGATAAKARGLSTDEVLDEIYTGPKSSLRALHERIISEVEKLGEFEIAPKKGYVSLRRKRQFAMLGPATKTQVELGLNVKGLPAGGRLVEVPPGGMCNYKVRLASPDEVDDELVGWIKLAYSAAN